MTNTSKNFDTDTKKEKLEFLDLYDIYCKLTNDNKMFIFGLAMGLQFESINNSGKKKNQNESEA